MFFAMKTLPWGFCRSVPWVLTQVLDSGNFSGTFRTAIVAHTGFEQVRLVSVKAERPNHPSSSHARQGLVASQGGEPAKGGGSSMMTQT